MLGLIGYVYWSTERFVLTRADQAIAAEHAALTTLDARAGRSGLVAAIERHVSDRRFGDRVYLLADPSLKPIVGNLAAWPAAPPNAAGWGSFTAPDWKPDAAARPLLRARVTTLPDGSHLLTGDRKSVV